MTRRSRGAEGIANGRRIVVSADGTIESACRYIDALATEITLSKGLGSRH